MAILVLIALVAAPALTAKPKPKKPDHNAVPGEIIVRFADGVSEQQRKQALAEAGAAETGKVDRLKLKFAKVDPEAVTRVLKTLESDARVVYAEPNYVLTADRIASDPSFGQL